ncbi:putative ssDNA binding protein [Aspergillus leporis]|uniref:Putative ssDNA binding protein n=1 Tax=Aspergillus leporis TaxID=41062 RepID=A0A5N5WIK1_9EURO|nr:putative ssDNA binding protein [Aspergillus leporis]
MSAFASSLRPMMRVAPGGALSARTFSSSSSRSVARMIITGRLAAAPELQPTSTGQDIIKYSVGTSFGPRDNRQTSWFKVASFEPEGSQRDFILNLPKGTLVYVEGDTSLRQWEDNEGRKHTTLNIVQKSLEVLKRPYNPDANTRDESQ